MAAAGVGEAHGQAHIREIVLNPFHLVGLEVDVEGMAHRADQLAHEPAGLAEVVRFRLVSGTGNDNILDGAVVVKLAQDARDQDGKGGGRTEPGADGKRGGDLGVKTADREAQILKGGRNPPGQSDRLAEFRRADGELTGLEQNRVIALAVDADNGVRIRSKVGLNIQVDCGGQNAPLLMIRVVAGKLCPAGYR